MAFASANAMPYTRGGEQAGAINLPENRILMGDIAGNSGQEM
jgi:hypothetical protein